MPRECCCEKGSVSSRYPRPNLHQPYQHSIVGFPRQVVGVGPDEVAVRRRVTGASDRVGDPIGIDRPARGIVIPGSAVIVAHQRRDPAVDRAGDAIERATADQKTIQIVDLGVLATPGRGVDVDSGSVGVRREADVMLPVVVRVVKEVDAEVVPGHVGEPIVARKVQLVGIEDERRRPGVIGDDGK